jgi:hypothetical protein
MNHAFLTCRKEMSAAKEASKMAHDIVTLFRITSKDFDLVRRRRDSEIQDDRTRTAVVQRASRLGLLMQDFENSVGLCVEGCRVSEKTRSTWNKLFDDGPLCVTPATSETCIREMETIIQSVQNIMRIAEINEHDSGSSSASDYSDSRTDTDSDDNDDSDRHRSSDE